MKIEKNDTYGVYVHIPFCLKKCSYCDFISYPGLLSRADCYLEQIVLEMEHYRGLCADTVYLGGGTPTCLRVEQLTGLLEKLRGCFQLTKDCEITVECNPKTADEAYFKRLRAAGANRLSIGIQSFHDEELSLLGRLHSAKEAEKCVKDAKRAGFANINLDLMFGLPGQTIEKFFESVRRAVDLSPMHLSCYSLILEAGTPLELRIHSGELRLPEEEAERAMYHQLVSYLAEHGYAQYEISNFSMKGFESKHNNKYWERKPYIGLGAAAHSQIGNIRFANPPDLDAYVKIASLAPLEGRETETISPKDQMAEFMFLGLRKTCGVSQKEFNKEFGLDVRKVYAKQLKKFCEWNLLEIDGDWIRLTKAGMDVSNSVFCEFL